MGLAKEEIEVLDVFDLAGLGHPVPLSREPTGGVELHCIGWLLEEAEVEEEAADDGACPALPVVAVENRDPIWIGGQECGHFPAYKEECLKGGRFVILPVIAPYVLQLLLLNVAATNVYSNVFVLVCVLKEVPDRINGVAVEFLKAGGGESHRNNSGGNVAQVQVVAKLLEPVLRPCH